MAPPALVSLIFVSAFAIVAVNCNSEVDALSAWKSNMTDPNNVLQSWDPTLVNPCTWLHVTCNLENNVTRLDLANAGLQGPLVPQLGHLSNLQYFEVFNNNISGSIPEAIGDLTNLISLGLHFNQLSGPIPASLGKLKSLMFLNAANNSLAGTLHPTNLSGYVVTSIIQDPRTQN